MFFFGCVEKKLSGMEPICSPGVVWTSGDCFFSDQSPWFLVNSTCFFSDVFHRINISLQFVVNVKKHQRCQRVGNTKELETTTVAKSMTVPLETHIATIHPRANDTVWKLRVGGRFWHPKMFGSMKAWVSET